MCLRPQEAYTGQRGVSVRLFLASSGSEMVHIDLVALLYNSRDSCGLCCLRISSTRAL